MNDYFFRESYKRTEEIFYLRQLGATLSAIGSKYDLSRESIRRILAKRERHARYIENALKHEFFENANYFRSVESLRGIND